MDTKKLLLGIVAGTIGSFIVGYLMYGVLLHSYFESNTMEGLGKAEPNIMLIAVGHVFFSAALTYIFLHVGNVKTLIGGLTAGVIIGLLISLSFDIVMYATTNMITDLAVVCVDAFAGALVWGAGGAAIGWVLGMGSD